MISGEGMDRNVVTDGTLQRQNDTAITSQGKTQTGRTVQEKTVAMPVQSFDQQIAVTSHRKTTRYSSKENSASRVTVKAVNTAKPEMLRGKVKQEPTKAFQQQVLEVTEKLQRKRENEIDDFLYCMAVIEEINAIQKNKHALNDSIHGSANQQLMISTMADVYTKALCPVLEMLEDRIKNRCGWIYKNDLNAMAENFQLLIPDNTFCQKMLANIYQKYIDQELGNIEYLVEFLPEEMLLVTMIYNDVLWLTDETKSPVYCIPLLDEHTIGEFKKRQGKLLQDIKAHKNNGKAKRDQEELDELRKKLPLPVTDMFNKRKHHEQLFSLLSDTIHNEMGSKHNIIEFGKEKKKDHQASMKFLEKVCPLCDQYDEYVVEKHTKLQRSMINTISAATRRVLLEIQNSDDTDPFRSKSLSIIDYLANRGWLHKWCKSHYYDCLKPQDGMNKRITHAQIDNWFNLIHNLLKTKTYENDMLAIKGLKELLSYEQDILTMDADDKLRERIKNTKHECSLALFKPILSAYKTLRETKSAREADSEMRQYKNNFIALNEYTFVLDEDALTCWKRRAFSAWHDDIDRLRNATSFNEKDINDLLQLKDIAPDAPNEVVFKALQAALTNIFQLALKNDTGSVSIEEKVAKLSEWVDLLSKNPGINQKLREYNEEWKQRYKNTAGDRTMTSSDTSPLPPAFVRPGCVDIPLSTDDCHSRTERQITPDIIMQPVTVPLHMPALAINQPFQHSVLPPSRTATAEIRPQSEQPLQAYHRMPTARLLPVVVMPHSLMYCSYPQPAPPHMPAPTTQQSVPVPCYTPTDQPTAEIRPQPEQPPQAYHESSTTGQIPGAPMTLHFPMHSCPQPTPPHMPASTTQQSVPVPCYTPTDQPTAEIRPQPEQPLQAYHESSTTGQIPGAPMTSHFPVYPYPQPAPPYMPEPTTQQPFQQSVSTPYYIPIDQPTAEIRPQPGQPLQAYHEALTTGQIPGAPMTSHFPVNPYAPQLPVYGQIQQKWQPVYQQPYESQSTVSPESRVNYSFNSGTQSLSEIPRNL